MLAHIIRFAAMFFLYMPLILVQSCKKEYHPVEGNADIVIKNVEYDPTMRSLTSVYGAMYFTGGVGGVLVIRMQAMQSIDDFKAFDRACPYEASGSVKVVWDKNDPWFAVCTRCKSKFNLVSRTVESGPSEYPLYEYSCDFIDGDIHVY